MREAREDSGRRTLHRHDPRRVARGGCGAGAIGERGGDRAEVGLLVNGVYEYIANSTRVMGYPRLLMDIAVDLRHSRGDKTGSGWSPLSVLGTGWGLAAGVR